MGLGAPKENTEQPQTYTYKKRGYCPVLISLPPKPKRIVIIGLGTGGMHSLRAAQKFDRSVDITVIERRSYDMFSPCGLPYAVGKQVESFEALKHTIPSTKRLHKLLRHEAKRIDRENKVVEVQNLETGEEFTIPYDKLVISTGSKPRSLNIPGVNEFIGKGIHFVSNPDEARRLQDDAMKSSTALIIGGGAIGLEIAFALKRLGIDVAITKKSLPAFPRSLDPDMSEIIADYLQENGIRIFFGKGIESVQGGDRIEAAVIDGETVKIDVAVMAVGVVTEKTLAEEAGLRIERRAVWTSKKLETSDPDIYAIGECALTFSGVDGTPIKIDLATTAYKQAVIAGANAAGADKEFTGALGTFVSHVGSLEIAATGFNTETATDHGFEVVSGRANLKSKPDWMPGAKEISVKIIVDVDTGRILGGHAVGEEGAAWRVNMISLAVKEKMSIYDFSTIELAYCPAVSELYDALQAATDVAITRLDRYKAKKSRN